jgi:hypothetical protein
VIKEPEVSENHHLRRDARRKRRLVKGSHVGAKSYLGDGQLNVSPLRSSHSIRYLGKAGTSKGSETVAD